ncbi:hypothetical protein HMPREF1544_04456 [Mucor circinelloides 1006PhL]|uniref:Nuclear fusion protein KAR5 n=1 Tax=Mucor circinelloides f. circinelloides (strain 1006PhL) TaxID=1220926 RepID=S2JJM5_MUCC1|nr:hypothetical protein HMPREF1544_04456 [Mucor circinelloides 1006PhL]
MLSEGCSSLANLDSIESMRYAILLTLCELSTAAIPIPSECRAVQSDSVNVGHDVITHCALTLSKAPQTWTSYSVMMCFAIRYPMEKEILDRLHENITLNQAKNFEILKHQHDYLVHWHQQEMNTFDYLKKSQHELWYQMQAIQQVHAQTANQVQMIFDTLKLVQNSTELVVNKYNSMVHYHMQELQSQLNEIAMRQAMEIDQLVNGVLGDLAQVEKGLSRMMTAQRKVIQDWDETKMIQKEYLDVWRDSIEQVNSRLTKVMDHSMQHLESIKQDISLIQDQISWLTLPFKWLHEFITNLYIDIRHYALKCLIHALVFNYVLNAKTGSLIKKVGSASMAMLAHFYFYRILMENSTDEPYVDGVLLALEYAIAHGMLSQGLAWIRAYFFLDDVFEENTPNEQPRSPSPAVVPQTNNAGHANFRQYHFHNYYSKEPTRRPTPELVQTTDEEQEDDDELDGILPMREDESRYPPRPFQRQ